MAAALPRPGVEVIQVFQTVTPTVVTPTLVPCVVGVCRQVVDVLVPSATGASTLNSQALVPLQAIATAAAAVGTPPVYSALNGLQLVLSLNNGPNLTIVFAGTPLSPAQVVAQILAAFSAAGITAFTAEVVGTTQWRIRSYAANQFQAIQVVGGTSGTSPAVLTAFGFGANRVYAGSVYYTQDLTSILPPSFPDPNKNLSQLVIDPTTVRGFLFLGGANAALLELLQTESFLENGIGTAAVVTGSVNIALLTYATAATVTGTTDTTVAGLYGAGGTLNGLTLILNVNGGGALTLTLSGLTNTANSAALLAAIQAQWPGITATQGGTGGTKLVLTDLTLGSSSTIVVGAGTANALLGLTAGTTTGVAGSTDGQTLTLAVNGGSAVTITFAPAANQAALLAQITAAIGTVVTVSDFVAGPHHLRLTTILLGALASIAISGGTALGTLGLTVSTTTGISGVAAIDSGSGQAVTPLLQFNGANFTASPTAAQVLGTSAVPGGGTADGTTLTLDDGTGPQTVTFLSATTPALVVSQINALFGASAGGRTIASLSGGLLALTSTNLGQQAVMKVIGGTALATLFLTAGTVARGAPFAPLPGDEIWVDGVDYATITQVAPGGNVNQLKINKLVPISNNVGIAWYIVAKNLSAAASSTGVTRPVPNLTVDSGTGALTIKPEILRDTQGNPVSVSTAQLYVAYHALRLDVTQKAKSPGLLRFSDTTSLTSQLAPVNTSNPLALGLYFALLNAPGIQVTGLGVDATTSGAPNGTADAYARAAAFLEGFEVYGIAPMTHDAAVSQIWQTHVTVMSEPENKGERVAVINPSVPTHELDTLVASGLNGNTTSTPGQFDSAVANLGALLLAQGLTGVGPYATAAGIYLDIGDGKKYNIVNVVGSIATLKTSGFLPGENDDAYYSTTALPSPLISEPFAIRLRGSALVLLDGTPDRDGIALTVQQTAQGYANRRVWSTFPDSCAATLGGIEQVIDGFYMNAAIVGLIAKQPPQQSFTNFPMTGFTRVIGSNDRFGERQLNVMAAGGNYIIVQDAPSTPLISRMALTTDMTSIETRTDSITKIVDFCAKFLRQGLKNFIGRFNITQGFLDSLGHVIQGLLGFLTESGVLIGANLNNLIQDTTALDTVLIDVTLDVPFPCNYIRLTLTI